MRITVRCSPFHDSTSRSTVPPNRRWPAVRRCEIGMVKIFMFKINEDRKRYSRNMSGCWLWGYVNFTYLLNSQCLMIKVLTWVGQVMVGLSERFITNREENALPGLAAGRLFSMVSRREISTDKIRLVRRSFFCLCNFSLQIKSVIDTFEMSCGEVWPPLCTTAFISN